MREPQLKQIMVTMFLLLASVASFAHHSPARFSDDQIVSVFGTVVRFDWKNPHVYLVVNDANDREWLFEANATSNLRRNGWSRDTFKPGDEVTVRAMANRDPDKTHAMLISAIDAQGTVMAGRVASDVVDPKTITNTDLNGVWRGDPRMAFNMLFGMIDHPVTEEAATARSTYDESMDPITECVTWPTPRLVAWGAFYLVELEVHEDVVLFRSEFDRLERKIYIDGRSHPENGVRTSQGHSIGWWEGSTLVVDTTLFADSISPVADGVPSGPKKHVVEKYTLSADGSQTDIEIFVEDPDFLAEPFNGKLVWYFSPNLEMLPFDCDPETSRRFVQ